MQIILILLGGIGETPMGVKHNETLNKQTKRNKDGKKSTKINIGFFQVLQMKIPSIL